MGAPEALVETWTLYAISSLIIAARIFVRWRTIGFRGFCPDDYLIFLSWGTYTTMTVAAYIVGGVGDLHALPLEQRKDMTKEQAAIYVWGTQWFCAGVATYILFIWTLKLNMLFLYQRIVRGLWVEKFIKPTIYLVIGTFIVNYLILFCACRPYNRMWVVYPAQGPFCEPQSILNMVPPLVFNIVTDICIMAIPAPVLIPVGTTIGRKIGLFCLFSAGIFIMIAAILRVTMVLKAKNGPTAAIWSVREDFVAIVVGQAILIRPMFSANFWTGRYYGRRINYSYGPSKNSNNVEGSLEMGNSRRGGKGKTKDPFSITAALATVNEDDHSLPHTVTLDRMMEQHNDISHQHIREESFSSSELEKGNGRSEMVIHVSKQVQVEAKNQNTDSINRQQSSFDAMNNVTCSTGDQRMFNGGSMRRTGGQAR